MRRGSALAGLATALAVLALGPTAAGAATGDITEWTIPNASEGIVAGSDGNLWFTEVGSDATKVGRITPTGSIREFPLPGAGSNSFGVVAGPDGNVWFTEPIGDRIGRITPAGAVTEFTPPTPPSGPDALTVGPDDALWFGEGRAPNAIGRMTLGGAFTEFPLPAKTAVHGITTGADGKLWFTNPASTNQTIGRFDPAGGALAQYKLGDYGHPPYGIAPGPDGNVWFSVGPANIGRITPTGTWKIFNRRSGGIEGLVTGSDGNIWFAEHGAHMIGRMTPSGTVTEYPLPDGSAFPFAIAAGPDGNVWYTTDFGNKIGRVKVAQPNTRYVLSRDDGFVPASTSASRGTTVRWSFYGPNVHRVADSSGLGLFDSGPKPIVSFYSTTLDAAGLYRYTDPAHPALTGKVFVPVTATPASGRTTTAFAIAWASKAPTAGRVFDVQVQRPGSSAFVNWKPATTATGASFTPDAGAGTYSFRSRLRDPASGKAIGYSAAKSIAVGP